jgi:hypothetical protein
MAIERITCGLTPSPWSAPPPRSGRQRSAGPPQVSPPRYGCSRRGHTSRRLATGVGEALKGEVDRRKASATGNAFRRVAERLRQTPKGLGRRRTVSAPGEDLRHDTEGSPETPKLFGMTSKCLGRRRNVSSRRRTVDLGPLATRWRYSRKTAGGAPAVPGRTDGAGRSFNQEAATAAHPRAPPTHLRRWPRLPSPAGGPLRNDGGLGLGGRHPSRLSMSGRETRLRSPFKVKDTNGRSVVGTRIWHRRSSPFTSGRVYGAAGCPV